MKPVYLSINKDVENECLEWINKTLQNCCACPRRCGVNRLDNEIGHCKIGRYARVSSAFPHFGEESYLVGWHGSGTIFFSGCNLNCVFCQNYEISQYPSGPECSTEIIAEMMLNLQSLGCHNINLVSPSHVIPQIIEALIIAKQGGLQLPIVYNTNSYDSIDSLKILENWIDIYMPDVKYWEDETARKYSNAKNYPGVVKETIKEMYRQVGDLVINSDGIAQRGLLVRHLVMPGLIHETKEILRWLAKDISENTYINIMEQYRPTYKVLDNPCYFQISRRPTREEMDEVIRFAKLCGLIRIAE
ncbi:MAG TPA: radical SAM protein [Candidatus Hydrogenedens sp.]|nr:radical SAM protein [Candidatus Hydrogenedens sp.]